MAHKILLLIIFMLPLRSLAQADSTEVALYDSAHSWNSLNFTAAYEGTTQQGTPYKVYAFRYKKLLRSIWFLVLSSPSVGSFAVYGRGKYVISEKELPVIYKYALMDIWESCPQQQSTEAVGDILLGNFYLLKGKNKSLMRSLMKNSPIMTKKGVWAWF